MKVERILISVDLAREMLAKNIGNRPLDRKHVLFLANEMLEGRWQENGDTICFSDDGMLLDGQHRLSAVVELGEPVWMLVVRGLNAGVFSTKDVGKKRTTADTLAVMGEVNCKKTASALAVLDRYMSGKMNSGICPRTTQIEGLLSKYPAIRESVVFCEYTPLLPVSHLVACHYLFAQKDRETADKFIRKMIDGNNLDEGDPIFILRKRLLENATSKKKHRAHHMTALVIKAWNLMRRGKTRSVLIFKESEESFPIVV